MRNPLTVALAAMALHAGVSLGMGAPVPSVGTFVAGLLGVVGAVLAPTAPRRTTGGMAAIAILVPSALPLSFVLSGLASIAGLAVVRRSDPLRNLLTALPAMTFLVLALTL